MKSKSLNSKPKSNGNCEVKIFNLITDSPQKIETEDFIIVKRKDFEKLKDKFYRPSSQSVAKYTFGKNKSTVERIVNKPQEGKVFWTHTLTFKDGTIPKSKLMFNSDFSEDICLLLSLFSGVGVYTAKSSLRYSHKSKIGEKIHDFEYQDGMKVALGTIKKLNKEELNVLGMVLAKYREAMQPASTNNKLVRLWEIVDIMADFYCENRKKKIPSGYTEKTLRKKLDGTLGELEKNINIPLRNTEEQYGFTPIQTEKSIIQKICEMIKLLKLADILKVDSEMLQKRVKNAYEFRCKLTHSSKPNFKDPGTIADLTNYSLFINKIVFVLLLIIIKFHPTHTFQKASHRIGGFLEDIDFYRKESERIKSGMRGFESALSDMISGKNLPKSGKPRVIKF